MTPEQYEKWKSLIRMCKSYQISINVGGAEMRKMLIAVDEFLGRVAWEKVEERKAAVKADLFSSEENRL